MTGKVIAASLLSSAAMVAAAPAAWAQNQGTETAQSAPATSSSPEDSSDVVVTARRQEERLSDVPIAVSVLSESTIDRQGATSVARVAQLTPGLQLDQGVTPGDVRPSLRGIPLIEGRSNVAILVDGIDVTGVSIDTSFGGAGSQINQGLLDLQRVEVIKGPQSVYFGRSAFSGAIQFVSKDPTDNFQLKANIAAGNRGLIEASAHVGGPIVDDILKLKLSASVREFDGFYRNPGSSGRFGDEDTVGVAAAAVFTPTSTIKATGRISFVDLHVGPPPVYGVTRTSLAPNFRVSEDNFDARRIVQSPNYRFNGADAKIVRTSLNVAIDLTDTLQLTTLTGYNDNKGSNDFDFDRTAATVPSGTQIAPGVINCTTGTCVGIYDFDYRLKQFSQEARVTLDRGSVRAMIGGYFFDERYDQTEYNRFVGSRPTVGTSRVGIAPRLRELDTRAWSAFGSLAIKPFDALTLTAEARYNYERINGASPVFTDLTQSGSTAQTIFAASTYRNFNPRFSIDYKASPETLLYASAARGSKPGGLNLGLVVDSLREYDQETIWTYETGLKTALFDRRLTLDAAAFYSDYRGTQITNTCFGTLSPGGAEPECPQAAVATINYIVNANKVRIYGLDVTSRIRLARPLTLSLNYTFTDTKILDLLTRLNTVRTAPVQFRGNELPLIPRHSFVGSIDLAQPAGAATLLANVTARYRSSRFARFDNIVSIADKTVVDAQLGFEIDHLRVIVFAENLLNDKTPDFSRFGPQFNPFVATGDYIVGPPLRQFGVRSTFTF